MDCRSSGGINRDIFAICWFTAAGLAPDKLLSNPFEPPIRLINTANFLCCSRSSAKWTGSHPEPAHTLLTRPGCVEKIRASAESSNHNSSGENTKSLTCRMHAIQ